MKIDFKDAYMMVPVHKESQLYLYLKFKWTNNTYNRPFPFGLANNEGLCIPTVLPGGQVTERSDSRQSVAYQHSKAVFTAKQPFEGTKTNVRVIYLI